MTTVPEIRPRLAGGRTLAPYAADAFNSRGRLIEEPPSRTRTPFQRDRDRIIHSDAFRRLKHKTQVFVHHQDDHYRTRLSHTIEVGQIARALARALGLDEDLAEALALVHDFGHTPFGHAGERALDRMMEGQGGFDHNAQSLRIVTELERRYAAFDGLNLTWETLEGLVKHNGPMTSDVPESILRYNGRHDLRLYSWPSAEAQCAAIADDIAYDNHDAEDGLRAGLFTFHDLTGVEASAAPLAEIDALHGDLPHDRRVHELVRRQITSMVEDVIEEAGRRLNGLASSDEVRTHQGPVVTFSRTMDGREKELKAFLYQRMYRHPDVKGRAEAGEAVVADLFDAYMSDRAALPDNPDWTLVDLDEPSRARRVADYIAGMTDRYALREHARWFDATPDLG